MKVAHNPAVIDQHPRPVGVENSRHTHFHGIHPLVIEAKGFSNALSLVVAAPNSDRIH
jgi:hypothetical protein